MTPDQTIIKTKVGLLELDKHLGNVTKACQIMGYRFKELYETDGKAVLNEISRSKTFRNNRVVPVALAIEEQPWWANVRMPNRICDRFQRTWLNVSYRVTFCQKSYGTLEDLQQNLHAWIRTSNTKRLDQRRWGYRKTSMQTWLDCFSLA